LFLAITYILGGKVSKKSIIRAHFDEKNKKMFKNHIKKAEIVQKMIPILFDIREQSRK